MFLGLLRCLRRVRRLHLHLLMMKIMLLNVVLVKMEKVLVVKILKRFLLVVQKNLKSVLAKSVFLGMEQLRRILHVVRVLS